MKKETLKQILIISVLSVTLVILVACLIKEISPMRNNMMPMEEEVIKDTSADDVDGGSDVNSKDIILDNYSSNITIKDSGEYNISGSFKYSIIVDSTGVVTLNLNNVSISSDITAAIANKGSNEMIINVVDGTTNTLKDSGSSDFDGCIYSAGKLTITGNGTLNVYGNQEEGEGIATTDNDITINGGKIYIKSVDDGINAGGDNGGILTINGGDITIKAGGDGIDSNKDIIINGGSIYVMGSSVGGDAAIDSDGKFELNGGKVIGLGSDMLQNPNSSSKQEYVSFSLNKAIDSGSTITLKNSDGEEVVEFIADEAFKTLIYSNSDLKSGTYILYVDGSKTTYSFNVR